MDLNEKQVFDAIFSRRSIRVYQPSREVEREVIIKLLQAAMAAPSACNIQPWEFIVLQGEKALGQVKSLLREHGNYDPPLVMVVCGYPDDIPWEGDTGRADCCAAIQNMLLAATAMGLGSVWIGGFDSDALRQALDIPSQVVPQAVVYFGYPAESKEPRTKYLEEAVYWGKYDPSRVRKPRSGNILIEGKK